MAVTAKSQSQTYISPQTRELHFQSIVIDTHDDTTQRLLDPKFDFGAIHSDGSVDIPRMRAGGLSAIFFSIWIPGTVTGPTAVQRALDQINAVREAVTRHPNDLVLCTTADEIRRAKAGGMRTLRRMVRKSTRGTAGEAAPSSRDRLADRRKSKIGAPP